MPWDYKPWGCGSGSKGSCNNGWIQFEICEDGLSDKAYFEKVYKEGCEITAYLCKLYDINPKATVTVNGVKIPTILCHADSHALGFGSNHGDVLHWFKKHGKTMNDVRNDVAKLLNSIEPPKKEEPAKKEEAKQPNKFKVGNEVKLIKGAKYVTGNSIPDWLFNAKLFVKTIRANGDIVFSLQKNGSATGVVKPSDLILYKDVAQVTAPKNFKNYIVKITADVLNVRSGPSTAYKVVTQVKKNGLYTIVNEKNGWGKLKSGAGWISLKYTKKI